MFVDEATISVKAGDGGNGCNSIQGISGKRYGKPTGGEGGDGGDVVFEAVGNTHTLLFFRYNKHFKAKDGGRGDRNNMTGRHGEGCTLKVPPGTIIRDAETKLILRELSNIGDRAVIALGGKGGRGNSPRRRALPGEEGETRELYLELKLLADVGLVGYPNAGKSTFVSRVSAARPRIASFPFTTKAPMLGVVGHAHKSFVIADIPGLIEGAHAGRGLGDRFLRHIERTKILLFLIDMAAIDGRDPYDDYVSLRKELSLYSPELMRKKHIVAANKMDMPQAAENLKRFKKRKRVKIYELSALTGKGIDPLVRELMGKVTDQ